MHTQVWPLVANLFSSYSSAILVFIFLIASQLGKLTPQLLSSTQSNISPLEPVHYSVYDIVALLLAGPMIVFYPLITIQMLCLFLQCGMWFNWRHASWQYQYQLRRHDNLHGVYVPQKAKRGLNVKKRFNNHIRFWLHKITVPTEQYWTTNFQML